MKKVLLYSGGMDSWLIDKLWKPDVKLFFNIGTSNSDHELERIRKQKDVEIIDLPLARFEQKENNYFLPLRNLHFVVYAAHFGDTICLGATGSSTHRDKNEVFGTLSENAINYLLQEGNNDYHPVKIVMPYRNKSKTEILGEYLYKGGDINKCYEETFSCYNPRPDGTPCMQCTSCLSKFAAFYNNGYRFGDELTEQFTHNVLSNPHSKDDSYILALTFKYKNKLLFIDFDNTITERSEFPYTGDVRKGCKEKLMQLKEQGYYLVVYTSRKGVDFYNCQDVCRNNELPIDDYIHKPFASRYMDDRAITFSNDMTWETIQL